MRHLGAVAKWQAMPLWPQVHKGGLLGSPQTHILRANMARSVSVALLLVFITLTLLFLLSSRFGVAHQSVNVRFDRDDLLHIPSCLLIFSIECFFFAVSLRPSFLQHIPFWGASPRPAESAFPLVQPGTVQGRPHAPQGFPAVLRRLILLKDWTGFGILNRCGL